MTTAGWIIMIGACAGITGLLVWCIHRVLTTPHSTDHLSAPIEIDTKDHGPKR